VDETMVGVNTVYASVRGYEGVPLTNDIVRNIFSEIDIIFYKNNFVRFIASCNPAKPALLYKEKPGACAGIKAMLEAEQYEPHDPEFATHAMGFVTAVPCLNSIGAGTVYYSGGYKTDNKLKFIILMLLHESLHILEYNDSILTTSKADHNLFFYYMAYKYFKIISRLSECFTADMAAEKIKRDIDGERDALLRVFGVLVERGDFKDLRPDGVIKFNDHSHAGDELLGYFVHPQFAAAYLGGSRPRRTKRKQRKQRKQKKTQRKHR